MTARKRQEGERERERERHRQTDRQTERETEREICTKIKVTGKFAIELRFQNAINVLSYAGLDYNYLFHLSQGYDYPLTKGEFFLK